MTKKLFFLLPILLTAFSISAQTRTDKLLKNLHDNESKYIFVIAHRGDWRNAPENSLQSIEKAIAMKVDMIELDIQPTTQRQRNQNPPTNPHTERSIKCL